MPYEAPKAEGALWIVVTRRKRWWQQLEPRSVPGGSDSDYASLVVTPQNIVLRPWAPVAGAHFSIARAPLVYVTFILLAACDPMPSSSECEPPAP